MADDNPKMPQIPNGAVKAEDIKRCRPKRGVFSFDGFYSRKDDTDLVERVRQSMCENLRRQVTELEARNHIKICDAIAKARHSSCGGLSPLPEQKRMIRTGKYRLDDYAADNGSKKNLRDWCFHWEGIKDGRVMASAGDIYNGFKEIRTAYLNSALDARKPIAKIIKGLRNDMHNSGLIAGTRIDYVGTGNGRTPNYYATILQHYNCQYESAKTQARLEIPHFDILELLGAAKLPRGDEFLQAFLCTQDTAHDIAEVFSFIGGIKPEKVKVRTPNEHDRKKKPHRVATFRMTTSLYICATSSLDFEGQSRGYLL